MSRTALTVLALVLFSQFVQARTVKGTVFSDNDSTAVIGASCRLLADKTLLAAAVTEADGSFSLETDSPDVLTLEVSMTGFNPTEIIIESGAKNISLGRVYLTDAVNLREVSVTANSMIDSRGRTIVIPSASDVKASATAIDLFQKIPLAGLDANPVNRTLSVDGGSPMILIDGVPSSMSDVNALKPEDIEKIEFSRLTPARYADRGTSGLINISLKKRDDGGSFYGYARSAVATAFFDASIRASYHQGPSQFTVYYSPSWRNYQQVYDNSRKSFIGDDFRVDLEEHDRNPFNYFTNPVNLKYNYSPKVSTLFSATLRMEVMTNASRTLGDTHDTVLGDYTFRNLSDGKDLTPSLDLYFRHDFNQKNSVEVQVVGTLASNDYRRDNEYSFADGTADSYVMDVDNRRRSLISEISYKHYFSDYTSFSAGYQNTVSHSTNTYLTTDYKPVLTENNNYVYASLGHQLGKVYLSLSTGAKLYWIKNDMNRRNFVRNLTTVQANWTISGKWSLAAAFRYSPRIPSLSALTDYPQQTSPYLVSNGNPDLKVAENFNYQLMPSYRYKKFSSSLLLTYSDTKNAVFSDLTYLGNKLFLSQSVNSRKSRFSSAGLTLKISDIAGFGASVNLNLNHYESAGTGWSHDLTSFSGNFSLWWNKGPITVSYWRKIPGKYLSGHNVGKEENGDALSLNFKPDKHWNIGASWMYMFDSKGTRYPSWNYSSVNPGSNERYIRHNGNMVVLSVSYSADFGSIFRTGRRSLNNSDNGSSLLKM